MIRILMTVGLAVVVVMGTAAAAPKLLGVFIVARQGGTAGLLSVPLTGHVVSVNQAGTGGTGETAEVRFTMPSGRTLTSTLTVAGAGHRSALLVGDPVPIVVSVLNPSNIRYDAQWYLRADAKDRVHEAMESALTRNRMHDSNSS